MNFKEVHVCPICYYVGYFEDDLKSPFSRYASMCPRCKSKERARLLRLVMNMVWNRYQTHNGNCAHFSPLPAEDLSLYFKNYETFNYETMTHDLCDLFLFDDEQYDAVVALHVIEHIKEDEKALKEISRVTKRFAVLPVPIFYDEECELDEPDVNGHIRKTRIRYYEKYKKFFTDVDIYGSWDFPEIYQTRLLGTNGKWYDETMPVCFK